MFPWRQSRRRFAENTFENRVFGKNVATGMVVKVLRSHGLRRQKPGFFDLVSTLFRFIFDPVSFLEKSRNSQSGSSLKHLTARVSVEFFGACETRLKNVLQGK